MTQGFDVDKYSYHECEIHNHGFYLGEQSRQAEIDELRKRIDDSLKILQKMKHNGAYRATHVLKGQNND